MREQCLIVLGSSRNTTKTCDEIFIILFRLEFNLVYMTQGMISVQALNLKFFFLEQFLVEVKMSASRV